MSLVTRRVAREFRIVRLFVLSGLFCMAFAVAFLVLSFFPGDSGYDFVTTVCGQIEPLVQRMVISCAIFFNEPEVRNYFLARFRTRAEFDIQN